MVYVRVHANDDIKLFEQAGVKFSLATAYNLVAILGIYKWDVMTWRNQRKNVGK